MDNDKVQEILLQLVTDMSYIKAKLDNIDEMKISSRIDLLEAQTREQERVIKSLENRSSTMEQFVRNNLSEDKSVNKNIWISIGIAMFTAVISFVMNLM